MVWLLNELLADKFAKLNIKLMITVDGADKNSYEHTTQIYLLNCNFIVIIIF